MKVLVIQQKMIGDVLASTVICEALKTEIPDCEVHYMIEPNTLPVVENNPYIDKTVLFTPSKKEGFSGLIAFGKKLQASRYDAVIDAYGKWESILPAYFSAAKIRIGNRKWYTSIFYTKTISYAKNVSGSAIYHRLQLAEALTNKFTKISYPKIYLTQQEINTAKNKVAEKLDVRVPIIMISVLGSGSNKSLPSNQMAETLDIIAESGNIQMLFNFMPNQEDEAKAIFNLCQRKTRDKIKFDFYTKSLREFLAVLSQCDALIGNEGGAVNMAKALGIRTFTIFSPWINKSSWDMLRDDNKHVAVHLADFHPEVYGSEHPKKLKNRSAELYKKLTPELFRSQLQKFVMRIIS